MLIEYSPIQKMPGNLWNKHDYSIQRTVYLNRSDQNNLKPYALMMKKERELFLYPPYSTKDNDDPEN